jgi:hypothetical protein
MKSEKQDVEPACTPPARISGRVSPRTQVHDVRRSGKMCGGRIVTMEIMHFTCNAQCPLMMPLVFISEGRTVLREESSCINATSSELGTTLPSWPGRFHGRFMCTWRGWREKGWWGAEKGDEEGGVSTQRDPGFWSGCAMGGETCQLRKVTTHDGFEPGIGQLSWLMT